MLDLKFIRENTETVEKAVRTKCVTLDLNNLLRLDQDVVAQRKKVQQLQEARNANANEVKTTSNQEAKKALIENGREIAQKIQLEGETLEDLEKELKNLLLLVPNIPAEDAPIGPDATSNKIIRQVGKLPNFNFKPLDHVDLIKQHGWAEFERITKISGSRNYSLCEDLFLLEQAILNLTIQKMRDKGFRLISVPSMCREEALIGTGHFPTGRDQAYHIEKDTLFLSGTAEVLLNSLHRDEILKEEDLPILYAGFSPCFRREAGSAGKDVRGLIRVHQFLKVEQFVITRNDMQESNYWHSQMMKTSEELLEELELPYQVVDCSTGDMGVGKYRMQDIETWVPSEKLYRETHSCSTLHDWQARRVNLRYRGNDGKVHFCHTLNNTAIATPRILVPFLENHQQEDGSIYLPKILRSYFGGKTNIP